MVFSSRSLVPFNYGDLIKTTSKKTLQNGANCAIGKNPPPITSMEKKKHMKGSVEVLDFSL